MWTQRVKDGSRLLQPSGHGSAWNSISAADASEDGIFRVCQHDCWQAGCLPGISLRSGRTGLAMTGRILIGTDEAGYGPNLGPLTVAATAWHLPDDVEPLDLWEELQSVLTSAPESGDQR